MVKKTGQTAETTVTRITIPEFCTLWSGYCNSWQCNNPFITPPWLKAWWRHFQGENSLLLLMVSEGEYPLGMAPLMLQKNIARFIGSTDLCDTADFIAAPGAGDIFSRKILHFLEQEGINRLLLEQVRKDSLVYTSFLPAAKEWGWRVCITPQAASVQMDLPASWQEYLLKLTGKQRHEVKRKLRRVQEAGTFHHHVARKPSETGKAMQTFLNLFCQSRQDKMEFMTDGREGFFRSLAVELSQFGLLSLHTFTINNEPAAAAFCIDLGKTTFLYNNGFNPRFREISLGIVSKIETIRASIENGQSVYDFLGGTERYKYQLGGTEVPFLKCIVEN